MIVHIVVCAPLISLIFSIPPGIQGVDIYQKVIDDLQFEDPRVPRAPVKNGRAKIIDSSPQGINFKDVTVDEVSSTNEEHEKLLSECKSKLKFVELEKTSCMAKQQGDGVPLFKQFIRRISEVLRPVDGDENTLGAKIILKKEQFHELQAILQKQSNAKEVIDLFGQHDAFHPLENSVSIWSKWLTQFNLPLVMIGIAAIPVSFLFLAFLRHILFLHELNWKRNVIFLIFVSFLFSIPWEWYRMYRVEYSKKMSESLKDIPAECNPNKNINMFQSIGSFFRDKFTFGGDECAKYHENLLVDPLWEVSPLNAISVCISRFVLGPMKMCSESLGVSFRLFFNEIPAQWQPFFFLALVFLLGLLIITCTGLRIEAPFLKINVNPQREVKYVQAAPAQNAAPVQRVEQNQNHQGRLPASQMQDNHNDRIETNVAQQKRELTYKNIGENNCGVVEVQGGKLLEAPKELSHAKDNSQLGSALLHKECRGIQNQHVQDLIRNVNDNASAEPKKHVEDNIPTLLNKCPSEHQDIQEDGRRSLPTESEYHSLQGDLNPAVEDVPASQDENDASRICFLTNGITVDLCDVTSRMSGGTHIDESPSSIVVPNESSVFSMPLDTGHSTAEISRVQRRRTQPSHGDGTGHGSEDSTGSISVENVSSVNA